MCKDNSKYIKYGIFVLAQTSRRIYCEMCKLAHIPECCSANKKAHPRDTSPSLSPALRTAYQSPLGPMLPYPNTSLRSSPTSQAHALPLSLASCRERPMTRERKPGTLYLKQLNTMRPSISVKTLCPCLSQ